MNQQPIQLLRSRDFGSLLQDSIQFFIKNFKGLVVPVLLYAGPLMILQGIALGLYQANVLDFQEKMLSGTVSTGQGPFDQLFATYFSPAFVLSSLMGMLVYVMMVSLVNQYLMLYVQRGSAADIEMEEVRQGAFGDFLPNLGAALLTGLLIFAGTMLFIFPGIYVAVPCSFVFIIMKYEGIGIGAALSRAFALIRGNWWQTFFFLLLLYIIVSVVGSLFQVPMYLSAFAKIMHIELFASKTFLIIGGLMSSVGSNLLYVLIIVGVALQYFNLLDVEGGSNFYDQRIDQIGRDEAAEA